MASLLLHSQRVPAAAREALRAAHAGVPELRRPMLEAAARILHRESGLACADAFELVDLDPDDTRCG